jgi:succinate dehydrogenase/fumarate reductase flavoprotein subunit
MICQAALLRTESRSSHYRTDFPEEGEDWVKNIMVRKAAAGMKIETAPVS